MMQMEAMTAIRQSEGVINRYVSFTGAGKTRGGLTSHSVSAGPLASLSLRAAIGSNPREFMSRQQQPDGE